MVLRILDLITTKRSGRESGPVFITKVFSKQAAQHVSNEGRAGYGEHVQLSYDHDRQTDVQLSEQSKSCSKHYETFTRFITVYLSLLKFNC